MENSSQNISGFSDIFYSIVHWVQFGDVSGHNCCCCCCYCCWLDADVVLDIVSATFIVLNWFLRAQRRARGRASRSWCVSNVKLVTCCLYYQCILCCKMLAVCYAVHEKLLVNLSLLGHTALPTGPLIRSFATADRPV